MPTVPFRGVGEVGVVTDQEAHDLQFNAWQEAKNLRFANGVVSRYSVFKQFEPDYIYSGTPIGIFEGGGSSSSGFLVTVFSDGTMQQRSSGVSTAVTPVGTLSTGTSQITTAFLGGLTYVNRAEDVPIYRTGPTAGAFAPIPAWDAGWRTKSLRSYRDFLIALNVTQGVAEYPVMVKWSDAAQAGAPPSNWDSTILSSLAGETILNDCRDALVDGLPLADTFLIYGKTQTFRMDYIGAPFVFRFQKVFDDVGMIAPNCAVEVDGKHYVFGENDIIMHDGFSKVSLVQSRVYDGIFRSLDFDLKDRCFVFHDRVKSEIGFCYVSREGNNNVEPSTVNGCNQAAVYNYQSNTWTFVDMPNVVAAGYSSNTTTNQWEDNDGWNLEDGSWAAFDGTRPSSLILASAGIEAIPGQPVFLDKLDGGFLTNVVIEDFLWDAYGLFLMKDLDELGLPLFGRKMIRTIVPQFKTGDDAATVRIQFGQAGSPNAPISWLSLVTLPVWFGVKYDTRINGRYLSMRYEIPAGSDVGFGGFDADVVLLSRR